MLPDPAFYAECIQASFDELKNAAERLGRRRRKAMSGPRKTRAPRSRRTG
jgi:hypothetical protein